MTTTQIARRQAGAADYGDPQAEYSAARAGAAMIDQSAHGRIWMDGADRAALLHRLSTNQIEGLGPGQATATVLTTPIGRIIDLLDVCVLEDRLLLLCGPGRGPAVYGQLKRNIFFNDRVTLAGAGDSLGQIGLYGPQAAGALAALGLPGGGLSGRGVAAGAWRGQPIYVAAARPIGGAGFVLLPPAGLADELWAALGQAGAAPLGQAAFEVLRVEGGIPAAGHELGQAYIPLETGLWDAVSFSKGCYVGQEIIARMESRGRLAKQLRGLRFLADPGPLELPVNLDVAGKEAGDLTSLARSPRLGPIGLAYVRSAHAEPGTRVRVAEAEAEVVALPFYETLA